MKFFNKTLLASLILGLGVVFLVTIFYSKTDSEKQIAVRLVRKIKNFVYYEATIHNPEGDILPDDIDDAIISRTKSMLE